jgi:hypothetical protein
MFVPDYKNGHVAERLGKGLQNLPRRFDSARDLAVQVVLYGKQSLRGCIFIQPLF